jgi:hypothetical protein
MDTQWVILCGLLVFPALLAAALIWIQIQDRRVSSWRQVSGRIVSSEAVARTIRRERHRATGSRHHTDFVTDETIETRNVAEVAYEFVVAGRTYQGSRIDLAPDSGNPEVAETLKRYPRGAIVTVFYDPADPAQCILERDDPKNLRAGWFSVAVLTALIVGGVLGVDRLAGVVRAAIVDPAHAPLVVGLGVFAAVVALFAVVVGRKRREMQAWTKTAGQIVQSSVETTVRRHNRPGSMRGETSETIYVPRVVYQYDAGGILLQGDDIGGTWRGTTPAVAATYTARFPLNMVVEVFFNPRNTTESTLAPPGRVVELVLWAIAAVLLAAGALVARLGPGVMSP